MPNERDVAHFRFRTSIDQVAAVNRKTAVSHGKLGLHNLGRLFECDCSVLLRTSKSEGLWHWLGSFEVKMW